LNNKIIKSSNTNEIELSLDSPGAVDQLVKVERNNLVQQPNRFNVRRQEFIQRKRQVRQIVNPKEVIRLNVGGQIIITHRETLTKVPNSMLAKAFDGSYQNDLQRDYDGSYFLDYNPVLFSHLLDQLRVLKNNESVVFRPPLSSLSSKPFNQMLQDLGLPLTQRSENDVIALNVGGEKIVTLRKTLTRVPDSNLALLASNSKVNRDRLGRPFLDYNPILFRHLLNQLREGKQINDNSLKAPANESQDAFNAMLNDLGVPSK
jgi:hypothetical protein